MKIQNFNVWDCELWAAMSRRGEVCGVFGCQKEPTIKCEHCGNNYCRRHSWVLETPGHQKIKSYQGKGNLDEVNKEGLKLALDLGNGVTYVGPQMLREDLFYCHIFQDGVTGTSFGARSLKQAKESLVHHRSEFKKKPPEFK